MVKALLSALVVVVLVVTVAVTVDHRRQVAEQREQCRAISEMVGDDPDDC